MLITCSINKRDVLSDYFALQSVKCFWISFERKISVVFINWMWTVIQLCFTGIPCISWYYEKTSLYMSNIIANAFTLPIISSGRLNFGKAVTDTDNRSNRTYVPGAAMDRHLFLLFPSHTRSAVYLVVDF